MSFTNATTWRRQSGFIWSMLGSAIGFANLLSFSSQAYHNGGGAFLIPYVAAILILGFPLLLLEGLVGHSMRLPIVSAYGSVVGRVGKAFGWLVVIAVLTIGAFYAVLTGYSIAYAWYAGAGSIPSDTASFFKTAFLRDTGNLAVFGSLSLPALASTLLVGLLSWLVMMRSVRSGIERICSFFLPILCLLVFVFACASLLLPGALKGIAYYVTPELPRLLSPTLWRDVFGQVFFSFSLGLGIVTAYSRHTGESTSIPRAMWYVTLGDLLISVVAGFAVFGCVGYLSHLNGVPISDIVQSESSFEMGFVIFPKILQTFGPVLSRVVGVLFFFCVFIAGITGLFSIMESVIGNIQVEFKRTRKSAAVVTSMAILIGAFFFCFGNGQALLGALSPMLLGTNMLIGGLAEVIVFMYMAKTLREDPMWSSGRRKTIPYYLLRLVVPVVLVAILWASVRADVHEGLSLAASVRWVWLAVGMSISCVLALQGAPDRAKDERVSRIEPAT